VHDLLLAKRGIAIPVTHGLRSSIERHKARLTAEFTKSRIRRKLSSVEALKAHVEAGLEETTDNSQILHPRWVRVNTLKTTLEEQLESTFAGLERALTVEGVRKRSSKSLYIDDNIPNLVAVSPNFELSKSEAYKSGAIIFQDKASCFPAYLLDPRSEDDDIIDSCAAPGNKTTHLAAILQSHQPDPSEISQKIHAFERNHGRADTLKRMVNLASSDTLTTIHAGQDFLKANPEASAFQKVSALLLDPSCSGSGIVGRDDMPELHLPVLKQSAAVWSKDNKNKKHKKLPDPEKEIRKRKREEFNEDLDVMVDDDGMVTAVDTVDELNARLTALSKFQLELLLHAFKFRSARKITYSTCSIHAQENEHVVLQALKSPIAKEKGWRLLSRADQIRGLREWPVRGDIEAAEGDADIADGCIRANKGDKHGTMGFFLAGFVRDPGSSEDIGAQFLRDEQGHLMRDMMGVPIRALPAETDAGSPFQDEVATEVAAEAYLNEEEEWGGIEEHNGQETKDESVDEATLSKSKQPKPNPASKHQHNPLKRRTDLASSSQKKKKRRK
jgi:putative methyltransferase